MKRNSISSVIKRKHQFQNNLLNRQQYNEIVKELFAERKKVFAELTICLLSLTCGLNPQQPTRQNFYISTFIYIVIYFELIQFYMKHENYENDSNYFNFQFESQVQ